MGYRQFVGAVVLAVMVLIVGRADAQPLTPNQKFVNQIYLDLLSRPASPTDLSTFGSALDSATITRTQFAALVTSSDEFLGDQVTDFYQLLLHRAPAGSEGPNAVSAIKLGQTFETTQAGIAGGGEYFTNRSGSTNDGFLDAIFADELKRTVDPGSRTTFDTLLASQTRTQVAQIILTSAEYRQDLVSTYYNEFLRRSPSGTDTTNGVNFLNSFTDQNYIDSIIASNEYFNLAQTIPEPGCITVFAAIATHLLRRHKLPLAQ
jgi:hypothetical protein